MLLFIGDTYLYLIVAHRALDLGEGDLAILSHFF